MEKIDFEVKLVHDQPVDLIQMANSLIALDHIAKSHISKDKGIKESKIMLNGVKEGSDIYQLTLDFGTAVLPLIDGVNTVNDILGYIKSYTNIDKKTVEEIKDNRHYNTVEAESIKSFIVPVLSNDDNSTLEIKIEGNNNAPIIINQISAKQIHDNADFVKRIVSQENITIQEEKFFEKVLIEMHKTTNSKKKVKDFAYCDEIIKGKAIATIIEKEEHKVEILKSPYDNYFLVNIEVVRAGGEVKLYRVVELHNIIPMEED